MPRLHLVRHARPRVDPATPPHTWELDAWAALRMPDVWRLDVT